MIENVRHFIVQSRQLVLKVVAFCLDMKASAPLPDCSTDNALVQFFSCSFDALNVFNSALINLFSHNRPDFVVHRI